MRKLYHILRGRFPPPKCKILTKISPDPLLLVRRPTERSSHFHLNPHVGQSLAHLETFLGAFWLIFLGKEAAEVWVGSNTILPQGGTKINKIKSHVEVPGGKDWEGGDSHPVCCIHFGTDGIHSCSLLQPLLLLLLCFARLSLQQRKAKLA